MARTLAHEGNPRTNSLVVAGTLDGEVFITVEGGSVPPSEPPLVPAAPANSNSLSTSCSNVFSWVRTDGVEATFNWQDAPCLESTGWVGSDPPHYILYDPYIMITLSPFISCYGVMYGTATAYSVNPGKIRHIVSFGGLVEGTPIAGTCCSVEPGSTYNDFTGIAMVYDFSTSTIYLQRWSHGDLGDINNGTTLASGSVQLSTSDIFYITTYDDGIVPASLFAAVYTHNDLATSKWEADVLLGMTTHNTFGVLCLGGITSAGSVKFGGSGSLYPVDCLGSSQITIQVQTDSFA